MRVNYPLQDSWLFFFGFFTRKKFSMQTDRIIVTTPSELQELISKAVSDGISAAANQRNAKELMNTKEICEYLGIHLSTLNKWKTENKIPYLKMGKRVFFKRRDVLDALKHSDYSKFKELRSAI